VFLMFSCGLSVFLQPRGCMTERMVDHGTAAVAAASAALDCKRRSALDQASLHVMIMMKIPSYFCARFCCDPSRFRPTRLVIPNSNGPVANRGAGARRRVGALVPGRCSITRHKRMLPEGKLHKFRYQRTLQPAWPACFLSFALHTVSSFSSCDPKCTLNLISKPPEHPQAAGAERKQLASPTTPLLLLCLS
jgi:hypothetical protein